MTEIQYKYEIINHLIELNGYRSYLEVATPQTGFKFAAVTDRVSKVRIWSHASDSDDDGQPVTYRMSSDEAFTAIRESGQYYDIIFVDAWHTFAQTEQDILNSLECLSPYGSIVVHDCNPPEEKHAGEAPLNPDEWCGNVYQAIIKLRMTRHDISVYVVDIDVGCAVIQKRPSLPLTLPARLGFEDCIRWEHFSQNRTYLLNLVSTSRFLEMASWEREHGALQLIYGSHGWKALRGYYRLRDMILPEPSKRRTWAKLLWNVAWDPLRWRR